MHSRIHRKVRSQMSRNSKKLKISHVFFLIKWRESGKGRDRLRVVSNFGGGDCGAGEIYTHARAKFRDPVRSVVSPRNFARVRVYISPAPQIAIARIRGYSQSKVGIY